jgi:hypothetical protein
MIDYAWHHALISDRLYQDMKSKCNSKQSAGDCFFAINDFYGAYNEIMDMYSLYTPKCVQTKITTTTTTTTKRRRNDLHFFSQLVSSISISSFFFLIIIRSSMLLIVRTCKFQIDEGFWSDSMGWRRKQVELVTTLVRQITLRRI